MNVAQNIAAMAAANNSYLKPRKVVTTDATPADVNAIVVSFLRVTINSVVIVTATATLTDALATADIDVNVERCHGFNIFITHIFSNYTISIPL